MSNTGNPAKERQEDVQEKGEATASFHEDSYGRQQKGKDNLATITTCYCHLSTIVN